MALNYIYPVVFWTLCARMNLVQFNYTFLRGDFMKKALSMVMTLMVLALVIAAPISSGFAKNTFDFKTGNMGKYSKDMKGVSKFFNDNKKTFSVVDAEKEFAQLSIKNDNLGYTHIKLQQMVDGIPVFGNEYIVHFNGNSEIYTVNGNFDSKARGFKKNKDFIKEKDAVEIAMAEITFDKESLNKELGDNCKGKLYLYNVNGEYVPVYLVRVNFLSPVPGDWSIFVNAYNGEIVEKFNKAPQVAVTGSGAGVLGDIKTLNLDRVLVTSKGKTYTQYQMNDTTRPAFVTTYTAGYGTRLPGSIVYSSTTTVNDPAAVDAHKYAGVVYDYYNAKFGRNSLNNAGMAIKSTVHYSRNYVNAFWNGSQMVYGDGDGVEALALSGALDVVAHEMTHAVDSFEANLTYSNQSGALNESISDCFGTFVEYYAQADKFDWLCGEDVWTPATAGDALRSLSDPTLYGQPAHMSNYVNTTSDNGGVHTNSGIPNKACYLVASSIGIEKTEQIYYRALANYFTSSTNFSAAKAALARAAADLYGAGSAEVTAVNDAFTAVGVN